MFICKADDGAVAGATAIEDNETEEHLDQKKLQYLIVGVIYIAFYMAEFRKNHISLIWREL